MDKTIQDQREKTITEFVEHCLGDYSVLQWKVSLNDNSEEEYTDFEVTVTNTTNKKKCCEVIRCLENWELEILVGEDMRSVDDYGFVMMLFLNTFLTYNG